MHFKATIRAATSSYLGSLSAAITGLLSIKLATHFLTQEEFGLWSFTMQTVGYFMLMDLGVSSSITRLLGDPLASGDSGKINSWFTLSLVILTCQAMAILGTGLIMRPYVLHWFEIPEHLVGKASELWLAFLLIQAIGLIFKLSFAILHAQNRVYWTNNLQSIGSWVGLGMFFLMASQGWGVLAYAWSSGMTMLFVSLGGVCAVHRGGLGFKLSLAGVTRFEVWKLFSFASSLFILSLASQVYFASQGLVATKMLGLESAAVLAVTGRASAIAMQMIWKPLDAFNPRWQVSYCAGELQRVTREFGLMTRFTILLAVVAAIFVALVNEPFVLWWTKPDYFGGLTFSLLLCLFMVIQGVNRCFITPFVLTLQVKYYSIVNLIGVTLAIAFMITLTRCIGLIGIPLGLITADLVFPTWFYMKMGAKSINVNGPRLFLKDLGYLIPAAVLSVTLSIFLERTAIASPFAWLTIAGVAAATICAPLIWRATKLLRQIKEA